MLAMFIPYALAMFFSVTAYEKVSDGYWKVQKYVPIGQHFTFPCEAYQKLNERSFDYSSHVKWTFHNSEDVYEIPSSKNDSNAKIYSEEGSYELVGYEIQRAQEGTFECHVYYFDDEAQMSHHIVSAIELVLQDCSDKGEYNVRNPCKYGTCQLLTSPVAQMGVEKLYCDCIVQYTGLYCDVLVDGVWYRELFFYAPTFFHVILTGICFICIRLWARRNVNERITLVEDMPDLGRRRLAFDTLYPAARRESPIEQEETSVEPASPYDDTANVVEKFTQFYLQSKKNSPEKSKSTR